MAGSKVCLVTLGCPKNIVEGESIAGMLSGEGWQLTTDLREADAAIVHTCSFIQDAKDESTATIRALGRLKSAGRLKKLLVTGCMAQEAGAGLRREFPHIDVIIGTGRLAEIPAALTGETNLYAGTPGGLLVRE
jgi:ribosomal protein S12 methylthiotransferase